MSKDKYTVRFLRIAEEDLWDIVSYIAPDNPGEAEEVVNKIEKKYSIACFKSFYRKCTERIRIQKNELSLPYR